jgi:hypothetical protein
MSRLPEKNDPTSKFCSECGSKLEAVCASCGTELNDKAKFCSECGSRVAQPVLSETPPPRSVADYTPRHLAERILAEQEAMETRGATDGERKTISLKSPGLEIYRLSQS